MRMMDHGVIPRQVLGNDVLWHDFLWHDGGEPVPAGGQPEHLSRDPGGWAYVMPPLRNLFLQRNNLPFRCSPSVTNFLRNATAAIRCQVREVEYGY